MVSHPAVHGFEGRLDRRCLHAHGLGAAGPDVCHSGPAGVVLVFVAIMAFESEYTHFIRVAFFGPGASASATDVVRLAAAPPDQLKKEAEKHGLDVSKAEVASEENKVILPGSAATTGETGKTASASGNPAGVAPAQSDIAAAAKAPQSKVYTVRLGDTLWKIAETAYGRGHGGKYRLIIEANKPLLSHPGKLRPGQALRIPPPPA